MNFPQKPKYYYIFVFVLMALLVKIKNMYNKFKLVTFELLNFKLTFELSTEAKILLLICCHGNTFIPI